MNYLARISSTGVLGLALYAASGLAETSIETGRGARERGVTSERGADATSESPPIRKSTSAAAGKGYSWSEKPRRSRSGGTPPRVDPQRPLVQAPNFELRSDGSSIVTLPISKSTDVTRTAKGSTFEYRLKDAQIGVHNNMNPLVTAHFKTPLERVVLRRAESGAALVLVLREPAQPLHQLRTIASGGALLEITLPPSSYGQVAGVVSTASDRSGAKVRSSSSGSARRHAKRAKLPVGPGPNP